MSAVTADNPVSSSVRFALLCVGVWLHAADSLVTATIAPGIVDDLGGVSYINWTLSLYEVGAIIAGAAAAVMCTRFGIKRIFVGATIVYGIGCIAGALASTMMLLVSARFVQGLGGGMLLSLCYVAVEAWFAPWQWGRLFSIVALVWGAGSLIGPLIGGVFAGPRRWHGAFWAFALQAAALAVCAAAVLPSRAATTSTHAAPNGPAVPNTPSTAAATAWPALQLVTLFVATLFLAKAGADSDAHSGSVRALAYCAAGVALLYLAARWDRRARVRLLPSQLLNLRHPIGAGLLLVLAFSAATTGFWCYGPLIMKIVYDTNPLVTGYILAGEAIAWSVATMAVSAAKEDADVRLIRGGALCITAGSAGFAVAVPSGSLSAMVVCGLLQGAGFGVCWPAIVQRIVRAADPIDQSLAAAASTVQRIGYALGTATVGIAANSSGLAAGISIAAAKTAGFWVFAAFIPVLLFGIFCAWRFTGAPAVTPVRAAPPPPSVPVP